MKPDRVFAIHITGRNGIKFPAEQFWRWYRQGRRVSVIFKARP